MNEQKYLSDETIDRLRNLHNVNRLEVQDWGDISLVLGYEIKSDQAYVVKIDEIEGVFVLLPKTFLEEFRRNDEIEVCGYYLWERWGSKRFMLGPKEHIGSVIKISRCHFWTVELDKHRVRHSTRNISEIKCEVDTAREYERRITVRIEKI